MIGKLSCPMYALVMLYLLADSAPAALPSTKVAQAVFAIEQRDGVVHLAASADIGVYEHNTLLDAYKSGKEQWQEELASTVEYLCLWERVHQLKGQRDEMVNLHGPGWWQNELRKLSGDLRAKPNFNQALNAISFKCRFSLGDYDIVLTEEFSKRLSRPIGRPLPIRTLNGQPRIVLGEIPLNSLPT